MTHQVFDGDRFIAGFPSEQRAALFMDWLRRRRGAPKLQIKEV